MLGRRSRMKETILELIETKDYRRIKELLLEENSADIAELFEDLPDKAAILVFRLLPKDVGAEIFAYLSAETHTVLINAFTDGEIRAMLSELYLDDTVDILEELPASFVSKILSVADEQTRREINQLLNYPEDSAGSIMTTEYVTLRADSTVEEAFANLRRVSIDKETIYTCYVTEKRRLIGVVTVKDMLIAPEGSKIGDIMETNVISANVHTDREEVAVMFDKYDFLAIPIVDNDERLVGIVTVDDAIDVMRSSATEDIEVMAAITPSAKSYLRTGVFELVLKRIPWLLLLMISATFTGGIITSFEESLGVLPILTAYIPMLMDTGGNAGGQASATIVRCLALGEVRGSDIFRIVFKEARVAIICGTILALVNFAKIMLLDRLVLGNTSISLAVAATVCITLALTVIIAKIVGCSLPIGAKKIGLDPAVMASPFITTIVDALALMAYFKVAVTLIEAL